MIAIGDLPSESWGIDETSLWIYSRSPLIVSFRLFAVVGDFAGDVDSGLDFQLLDSVPSGSVSVVVDGVERACRVGIGGSSLAFVVSGPAPVFGCWILFRGDVASSSGIPDGCGGGVDLSFAPVVPYLK
jgi:hypothetical protein